MTFNAALKLTMRILLGGVVLLVLAVAGLIVTVRIQPVPLKPITFLLQAGLANYFHGQVEVEGAKLGWSDENAQLVVVIDRMRIVDTDAATVNAEHVSIGLSAVALYEERQLAISHVVIDRLHLTPSKNASLPGSAARLLQGSTDRDMRRLKYFRLFAVRDIMFEQADPPHAEDGKSEILLTRDGDVLKGSVNIAFRRGEKLSALTGTASLQPGTKGKVELALHRINPRDIGAFSRFLAPLQVLQLPITGQAVVNFDADLQPDNGVFNLTVAPGALMLPDATLDINEINLDLRADFVGRTVDIADARFNIAGVGGALTGSADYTIDSGGTVRGIDMRLDGRDVVIDRPALFENKMDVPIFHALLAYDTASTELTIDRFSVEHGYGEAEASGVITLAGNRPVFDFVTRFGPMSRAAAVQLWPLPVARRTRQWANDNLMGGKLSGGSLTLRAGLHELIERKRGEPIREEAIRLDLSFTDIDIRYLKHMPVLANTNVELSLGGTSFRATTNGGAVNLPIRIEKEAGRAEEEDGKSRTRPVEVYRADIMLPNFRAPGAPAQISFDAEGDVADIMRALNRPPINLVRKIDFDFDRLRGSAHAEVKLDLPLVVKPGDKRPVRFLANAQTRNLAVTDKLGAYSISEANGFVTIDNDAIDARGRARANGVNVGFSWWQPLAKDKADEARMGLHGVLQPQEIADLGFGWAGVRLNGPTDVNVLVSGPVARPHSYRVFVDLTQAEFMPRPLAYNKPIGAPAHIEAMVEMQSGAIEQIRARLHVDGEEKLATQLDFDGPVLRQLSMTPLNFGRDRNLNVSIVPQENGSFVEVTADVFDAAQIFDNGNAQVKRSKSAFSFLPFLGPDVVIEGRVGQVVGAHEAAIDATRLRLVRKDGIHEQAWLEGVFADGTDVLMTIERDAPDHRQFNLQTERAGNLFRLFDWVEEFYDGSLAVQGTLYDGGVDPQGRRRDMKGRLTMVDFRVRNVGVLAQILTLASLTGIADTLTGDGIKFNKAKGNFHVTDGRVNISKGQINGPGIGFTVQGDFDYVSGDVDVGGTLVPAYSINSLLGKVPLLGRILASREGEGVVGIGYRIFGEAGDVGVLVNPLSVLTPGVFRRLFEFGIGLPDKKEADEAPPPPPPDNINGKVPQPG